MQSNTFEINWGPHLRENVRTEVPFSGRLLSSLYYQTDVGSIPRGFRPGETPAPSFYSSPNWRQPIHGCYWCGVANVSHQTICCSTQCIIYLHEWCVFKANEVRDRGFICRYSGCDQNCNETVSFCSEDHWKAFQELSPLLNNPTTFDLIQKGPKWYMNADEFQSSTPRYSKKRASTSNYIKEERFESNDVIMKGTEASLFVFSPRLYEGLILCTDIGPIPRESKCESHLSSQFAHYQNWCIVIEGCYWCGKNATKDNKYVYTCDKKCYSLFHEWCRRKYQLATGDPICPCPGCDSVPGKMDQFCSEDHMQKLESDYKTIYNMLTRDTGSNKGPDWYNNEMNGIMSNSSNESYTNGYFSQRPCIPYFLSETLTKFLIFQTDIGPIPRELIEHAALLEIRPFILQPPSNWNIMIPGCYWCCNSTATPYNRLFCSPACFFLFNEWCYCKFRQGGGNCCKYLSCENITRSLSNCCQAHAKSYAEEFDKFSSLLTTAQFKLGPKWYNNRSLGEIEFYNRDEPFYEFTNFFSCNSLVIDGISFPTSEHYFQSQKFVGTPYTEFVSTLSAPRDAFNFSRTSEGSRWIRPDWVVMREAVMYRGLREKFMQNPELGQLLVNTCTAILYEHTSNDSFWGDGGNRRGQNKLGQILMKIRAELQAHFTYLPATLQHYSLNSPGDTFKMLQNLTPLSNNTDEFVDEVKPNINDLISQGNIPTVNSSKECLEDQKPSINTFDFSLKNANSNSLPLINLPATPADSQNENRPPPFNPEFSNQASPGSMDCHEGAAEDTMDIGSGHN